LRAISSPIRAGPSLKRQSHFAEPALNAKGTTFEAWKTVFSGPDLEWPAHQGQQALVIADRLSEIQGEVDLVRKKLVARDYSESTLRPHIASLLEATSPMHLAHQWAHPQASLTEGTIVALQHWTEMLPNEEHEVDASQLKQVAALVAQLETELDQEMIPGDLEAPESGTGTITSPPELPHKSDK
jgi:hypothetical protein